MINIGIGVSWAKSLYSVANNIIANFRARVLSYPNSIFEAGPCLDATLEELNAVGLLDDASLIVTPNAYNEGVLYDVIPNTPLGDMDVVRATTATRVNSAGLIEVVPRNLLTYSNDFTNAIWTKDNVTLTSGVTSPSGVNNAFKLVESATTASHSIYQTFITLPSSIYTTSIYVKKGERFKVAVADRNTGIYVAFNLNTGTIIASNSLIGSIELLNNDWYRLTVTTSSAISVYVPQFFILEDSYTTGFPILQPYLGNGTSGIFIYASQLENFPSATEYFPTTTRLNIPRIDYTNGSCPSLLVEPQRTNTLTYSNEFSNAAWSKNTGAILANNATSPEGITNASKLVGVALTTQQWIYRLNAPVVSGSQYTFSIFAKKGEYNFIQLRNLNNINSNSVFNLNTGTIYSTSTGTAKIENYGNGWYRCSVTATATATSNSEIYVNLSTDGTSQQSFLGNGTSGVFIYGAQHETGAYPTSYIPTVASTVTRNADVISKTGISSLIGQTEGTLFCEINLPNPLSNGGKVIVAIGTSPNRIYIAKEGSTTNFFQLATQSSSGFNFINSSVITTPTIKFAIAYKGSNNAFYINGSLISSASAVANPTSFSNLLIGDTSPETNTDIKINSVQLYKTRLTDEQLTLLTGDLYDSYAEMANSLNYILE